MNFFKYIAALLLLSITISAQAKYEIIFSADYSDLPFNLRIGNSGIYSVASFDVSGKDILFSGFDTKIIYKFNGNRFEKSGELKNAGRDFAVGENASEIIEPAKTVSRKDPPVNNLLKINYFGNKTFLSGSGGILNNKNGDFFNISVDRNNLNIRSNINHGIEFKINFAGDLACADLIGVDDGGSIFLLIEKYLTEIPLKVQRSVFIVNSNGGILNRIILPDTKYLYTLKDLLIDSAGNLYHLYSDSAGIKIFEWSGLTTRNSAEVRYPAEFDKNIHFNYFTKIKEPAGEAPDGIESTASRAEALHIAETYAVHQFYCNSDNLAPTDVTAPDGDVVRTPDRLIVGWNGRIPYKWGGFNTIAQFDAALQNGRYAGDINTDGVSSYAAGVDCSGFVSRCWQMSYHSSTANMPSITTQYSSWDDLKPGDGIHKVGHVRLFVAKNPNGSLKVIESTSRGWGVSYWSYNTSDLTAYTPRAYNNMISDYNPQRPDLKSAVFNSDGKVKLKWECDETGVIGYRVYSSSDNENWTIAADENNCTEKNIVLPISGGGVYFRVSSVKNLESEGAESNWSNALGAGKGSASQKLLIVDGFERESGSWRGAGHTFAARYGKAFAGKDMNFESVKNSELINLSVFLEDYDMIFWILGDESTVDETFSSSEQALVKQYLENGGALFVSGSEIGWDLDYKGDSADKEFYHDYLKAEYLSDDSKSLTAEGIQGLSLTGCSLNFGQMYDEDYPDEIAGESGGELCMKYGNGKGAGIQFDGTFGSSNKRGKLIYLAFPLETTANDSDFSAVIESTVDYFLSPATAINSKDKINYSFSLYQNYPNPFNPATTIKFDLPEASFVSVKIYNMLGREIRTLVNSELAAGTFEIMWNGLDNSGCRAASGAYIYRVASGRGNAERKMILLK